MKNSILLCLLFSSGAFASIPIEQAASEKKDHYLTSGVFVGGFEQGPATLVNVRHSFAAAGHLERIVFDVSHNTDSKDVNRPGFFHVAIKSNRVVIDLEDLTESKVTEKQVTQLLSKSHFFSSASFFRDTKNGNLTISMPLKAKVKIEIFELASTDKPGRIVIDAKGP